MILISVLAYGGFDICLFVFFFAFPERYDYRCNYNAVHGLADVGADVTVLICATPLSVCFYCV